MVKYTDTRYIYSPCNIKIMPQHKSVGAISILLSYYTTPSQEVCSLLFALRLRSHLMTYLLYLPLPQGLIYHPEQVNILQGIFLVAVLVVSPPECQAFYGFTDDVPELLLAADIVVTKAGGLTAAETLIAGCNYIIYKPLPGQETGNAVYLEQYCGAQVAGSPQEVKTMVCRYADVDSQVRLLQKQQRSLKYGKPGAAEEISNYILKKLEK